MANGPSKPRASREAFFVRVEADGRPEFFDATSYLGKQMPFSKPKATCAMRASADAVVFSLLHTTKTSAPKIAEAALTLPRGPLARLERRALAVANGSSASATPEGEADGSTPDSNSSEFAGGEPVVAHAPLADNEVFVEFNDEAYLMTITRDANGIARLEMVDEDLSFEAPRNAIKMSVFLRSPKVNRILGVGFIGHLRVAPGTPETLTRAASMVLNSVSGLVEFRILSGIETVDVPAPPARVARPARRDEERVHFDVPVRLFNGDPPQPVAAGIIGVEVDLAHANPATSRLLYLFTPEASIGELFEPFRSIFTESISHFLRLALGEEELSDITLDIVLGQVASGTVERLTQAAATIGALDLTPRQFRQLAPAQG